jgi:hypothetical protein
VAAVDTEQQLAWERRQRPRAAIAAALAALLGLGADIWSTGVVRGAPSSGYLDALQRASEPGRFGSATSNRTGYFQWISDHSAGLIGSNVLKALSFFALAWALTFLAAATRARRPIVARPVLYVPIVGAILSGLAAVGTAVGYADEVNAFLAGPHTVDRAADAGNGTLLVTSQLIGLAGGLALAVGFVFVSLNAMRAGLLTRFMGILGCIIGVLVVIPIGPLPIVQTFWLGALAALFLGQWPRGMPPAWTTGKEERWPSQTEVAQRRRAAMEARRGGAARGPAPAPASGPAPTEPRPTPARAKKKRKRR